MCKKRLSSPSQLPKLPCSKPTLASFLCRSGDWSCGPLGGSGGDSCQCNSDRHKAAVLWGEDAVGCLWRCPQPARCGTPLMHGCTFCHCALASAVAMLWRMAMPFRTGMHADGYNMLHPVNDATQPLWQAAILLLS